MKIIILELNEVPHKVITQFFGNKIPGKYPSDYYQTISLDKGHISPWITWSTVHRGVTNEKHGINDINQYSDIIDEKYPTIFSQCIKDGFKVGIANTMHSGILAEKKSEKYQFLIPEAFSNSSFCIPKSLEPFQKLNLALSRQSSRVVSTKIPKKISIFKALGSYILNTNHLGALGSAIFQIFIEKFNKHRVVRRRTIQSNLIFDLFLTGLEKKRPDLSVFFTNHVASTMHRFWEATYPNDYKNQISSDSWIKRYKNEIPYAMNVSIAYINKLKKIIDNQSNMQLWIISSMGQERVENYKPEDFFWDIVDINKFVSSCLGIDLKVQQIPQMIPLYSFKADKKIIDSFESFLSTTNNMRLRGKTKETIAFSINNQTSETFIGARSFTPKGLEKKIIEEQTSSAAYHIPYGFLMRYGPGLDKIKKKSLFENKFIPTHEIKEMIYKTLKRI